MQCPKCGHPNEDRLDRCERCEAALAVAVLEVTRGEVETRVYFLKPRDYSLGRARQNDIVLVEPSISKSHARLSWQDGHFRIQDLGSLHGLYVNAVKVTAADLAPGALVQLGNVSLRYEVPSKEGFSTDRLHELPWVEQQKLLLDLVQTINASLELSQVLEQALAAVMRITRAERGFLLLAGEDVAGPDVAGLRVRLGRRRDGMTAVPEGISTSVVRRALESGEVVATGNAAADPALSASDSVILMDLRTIVCLPLRSPRAPREAQQTPTLGALYVDNHESSAPFSFESLRTAEALARHAALAIENAQLFERERRTIEELRLAQKQLLQSEKLATIGQMAAGIAHELNTPLTYILGNLELLESRPLAEEQREMLRSAIRGADRIRNLAQSMLAFSRPAQEEPVPLVVNEVVSHSLELCHYQVLKSGARLETELAPGLPPVRGVANQLEMAFINLIVNALHAMGPGGLLRVSTALRGAQLEIAVADDGAGIPPEVQAQIFEPFFTTKTEGRGSGLGLSTVLMVVERHGGRIDFESRLGEGTTFRILLPVG
jgi:signal transduction histidine kinase